MPYDHWAVSACLVITSALALTANALLLLVFFRRRGLRTVSNRFVMNLLITNLLSSIILIPLLLIHQDYQSGTRTNETSSDTFVMQDVNSSSYLAIENIQFYIETEPTTEVGVDEIVLDEELEVEIVNYKHFVNKTKFEEGSLFLCYLSSGSTNLVCTASILSILLIAIDQYFAVTHPLRYHTFIDKYKSVILLVTTWLLSALFGILGSFVQMRTNVWDFCPEVPNQSQMIYNYIYAFIYLFIVILMPFVIICILYGCIYCAAHRNSERMRKSNSGNSNTNLDTYVQVPLVENRLRVKVNSSDQLSEPPRLLPKVKSAPNFANLERARFGQIPAPKLLDHANSLRSNPSFINSLKTKISNASLFKYREETRAAKISVLVIFMVLVCYVPYGLTLVINTSLIPKLPREHFNQISLSLLVLANLLSPFLFAYRNRRIQRELRRLFGLLPRKSSKDASLTRPKSVYQLREMKELTTFIPAHVVPEVVTTCKVENEKKSILKRVCSKGVNWSATKKCNFIPVPECLTAECRCSFSSASTQVSSEEYSVSNQFEPSTT